MIPSLKKVSLTEAKLNKDYFQVVEQMYREQAARILQRAYRTKTNKTFQANYTETLKGPLSLRFIQEPWGIKNTEHALYIKANQWLALDFSEPEFVRNLYKALRLAKISVNELVTVLQLHTVQQQFPDQPLQQHAFFDTAGPYHIENISYATDEQVEAIKVEIAKLPSHERYYFSINFLRYCEIYFLEYFAVGNGINSGMLEKFKVKHIQDKVLY